MPINFRYCPQCAAPLLPRAEAAHERLACATAACGFVHYGNPLPVVAAIVDHPSGVVLVRNKGWPSTMFGLVTGFLEAGESPEVGVLREVKEELGLTAEVVRLVGAYTFDLRNELIVAFHVRASGEVTLGDELEAHKHIAREKLRPWDFGTGHAVRDWLAGL